MKQKRKRTAKAVQELSPEDATKLWLALHEDRRNIVETNETLTPEDHLYKSLTHRLRVLTTQVRIDSEQEARAT